MEPDRGVDDPPARLGHRLAATPQLIRPRRIFCDTESFTH